jgi:hypothetical protein
VADACVICIRDWEDAVPVQWRNGAAGKTIHSCLALAYRVILATARDYRATSELSAGIANPRATDRQRRILAFAVTRLKG